MIKKIARLIVDVVQPDGGNDRFRFVGHIGGDDFIVISRPHLSLSLCQQILGGLQQLLPEFHGKQEVLEGFYTATDRQGAQRRFPLLSISIGIVSTEECAVSSYGEMAFLASGVKKMAKQQKGSTIFTNRRIRCQTELPALAA